MTIFDNGNVVKTQEPSGLHFILRKNTVLKFRNKKDKIRIKYIDGDKAELLDDDKPMKYSLIDSPGIKRKYKFIYSKRLHIELYDYIKNFVENGLNHI